MLAKPHFRVVPPTTGHWPLATGYRTAFTLVEMLIAMVLTLILVTAIAQFYAIVGESVKDGRAMIEMGGQLRAAVERLKSDLDLITVSVVPWTDDGGASGYFEYFEGRGNDYDANGNGTADSAEDLSDGFGGAANTIPDLVDIGITNMIGDGDDFLAFTIRTSGEPFTGRYCARGVVGTNPAIITSSITALAATATPTIVNSQLAEVVWWVGFDDTALGSTARTWDFIEPRQLYRRQLLIRPELGKLGNDYPNTVADWQTAQRDLMRFWQYNDISASIRAEFTGTGTLVYRIRANSLSDLTKRENRFAHMPLHIEQSMTTPPYLMDGATFPHAAAMTAFSVTNNVALLMPCFSAKSSTAGALTSYALQTVTGSNGENPGEDIMLSNLLAFDVQIFDPYARVWPNDPTTVATANSSTTALVPSDPGYSLAAGAGVAINTPTKMLGLGAFVDLNYYRYVTTAVQTVDTNLNTNFNIPLPYFAGAPSVPPGANVANYYNNFGYNNVSPYNNVPPYISGAMYDTWSLNYERDGIDQSGNGTYDQQTNGLDDPVPGSNPAVYVNGVDDVSERDTIPPYSQPLRGLQVRIRLYEPSTRQARQATVATDFVTE